MFLRCIPSMSALNPFEFEYEGDEEGDDSPSRDLGAHEVTSADADTAAIRERLKRRLSNVVVFKQLPSTPGHPCWLGTRYSGANDRGVLVDQSQNDDGYSIVVAPSVLGPQAGHGAFLKRIGTPKSLDFKTSSRSCGSARSTPTTPGCTGSVPGRLPLPSVGTISNCSTTTKVVQTHTHTRAHTHTACTHRHTHTDTQTHVHPHTRSRTPARDRPHRALQHPGPRRRTQLVQLIRVGGPYPRADGGH